MEYRVWDIVDECYLEVRRKFTFYIEPSGRLNVSSGWNSYKEPTFDEETDQSRYIIEWCTGLKDKRGYDIFAGDIDSHGHTFVYRVEMGGWYRMRDGEGVQWHEQSVTNGCLPFLIIGTIHDKEQLEKIV